MKRYLPSLFFVMLCVLGGCSRERGSTSQRPGMEKRNQPATDLVLIPEDSPKLSRIRIQVVEMSEIPLDEVVAPGKIEVNPNRVSRVATEMVASEQTGGLSEEQVILCRLPVLG